MVGTVTEQQAFADTRKYGPCICPSDPSWARGLMALVIFLQGGSLGVSRACGTIRRLWCGEGHIEKTR